METLNIINSQKIKDFMAEHNLTKIKFCKQCKIGMESLEKILRGCYSSKILALYRVAIAMNCNIKDLFCQ